jgi:membrane protein required for colicin V production
MDVDVDLHVSLFDFIIAGVMIWGIYKGYMQGFIVQTIALFVLLAGVFVGAKFSMLVYNGVMDKSAIPLPNFPVVIFAIIFGFVAFASNWTALFVQKQVSSLPKPITTRVLGAFFGAIKYAFIISIMLLFIDRLDEKVQFIPNKENERTLLYQPFKKFAPTILPRLNFAVSKEPALMEIPDIDLSDLEN